MAQQVVSKHDYIEIRKRPWYVYVIGLLWIGLIGFLAQNALPSIV